MLSAVGIARANAVKADHFASKISTSGGRDSAISDLNVCYGVADIISSFARHDNDDDNDDEDDQEGDADAERTADAASAEASFGNLLAVIVNPFVAVVNLFAHLEGNLFI